MGIRSGLGRREVLRGEVVSPGGTAPTTLSTLAVRQADKAAQGAFLEAYRHRLATEVAISAERDRAEYLAERQTTLDEAAERATDSTARAAMRLRYYADKVDVVGFDHMSQLREAAHFGRLNLVAEAGK